MPDHVLYTRSQPRPGWKQQDLRSRNPSQVQRTDSLVQCASRDLIVRNTVVESPARGTSDPTGPADLQLAAEPRPS